jgi:K(+)-stimulated pyrophosphate-energized sodium pump
MRLRQPLWRESCAGLFPPILSGYNRHCENFPSFRVKVGYLLRFFSEDILLKSPTLRRVGSAIAAAAALLLTPAASLASEADLHIPDLTQVSFHGVNGHTLLAWGLVLCIAGIVFGLIIFNRLKNLPAHRSMLEVSHIIYETCKTYLLQQAKFILILEAFIAVIILVYFGMILHFSAGHVITILAFSIVGILGSYAVAAFGIRINTFANSRTAQASLAGKPYPLHDIPLQAGMSIGMVLISIELLIMLLILLYVPKELAGVCFVGFAIGESLGAAALRIAGGIFTKIADIGADLMKIVFNVKEDDARNPGVIADCTGDNAGDSVGPTADGFETYGVTGVALITFIVLAVPSTVDQVKLLVWIFVMRLVMLIAAGAAYLVNRSLTKAKYEHAAEMDFESPLQSLVWLTSIVSIICTYIASYIILPGMESGAGGHLWWQLATIISCGTLAGAIIPEVTTFFTSTKSRHVKEIVTASREGGAGLNILSGFTAGNFSSFWIAGFVIIGLMAIAYGISTLGMSSIMHAEAVFAFGLVAFGFLGMGPVTIAVDSYGPVTDNAQSVFELSLIEQQPGIAEELKRDFNVEPDFAHAKLLLEENDGAGNTFKASAKPVLIGTAVVGATTLIFSIIMLLTSGLTDTSSIAKLSILHAPFFLGLMAGGAVIFWFSGASCQAVVTGAYRAVAYIKRHMKFDGSNKASIEDSKKVVQICTQYAQIGMFNIFVAIFCFTLAAAFTEPFFFVAYLIGLAVFGLFQAVFMANAGGAWDNAKKIVEVELHEKGTELHNATVVGDIVGDPFKDTSSVALNPVIKFSTLFGLLAAELGHHMILQDQRGLTLLLAAIFWIVALAFVYRSFYGMRIHGNEDVAEVPAAAGVEKATAV